MIRERGEAAAAEVALLAGLGFGRADLVVAAPKSWIDVESLSDVHEVAGLYLARTGQRLRVATKYGAQTRAFFASVGISDYRIVDSAGATEGAPAAGAAELVVDITTTGATLEANNLKIVGGGVILRSQAQLAASLRAPWSAASGEAARRFVRVVEARARAKTLSALTWPAAQEALAREATARFLDLGASPRRGGLLIPAKTLFDVVETLAAAGVADVEVTRPHYVFAPPSAAMEALIERLAI
jgi:ATP phosphoribosyltransferase